MTAAIPNGFHHHSRRLESHRLASTLLDRTIAAGRIASPAVVSVSRIKYLSLLKIMPKAERIADDHKYELV